MKRTGKKFLVAVMAMLLAATAFVGCAKKDEQKPEAKADWEYIADKGEMTIGITYFAPMNFKNEAGELTGFETEFATEVCKKLGVKPNFIEIEWSAKETELNSKNVDCLWNGFTVNEERKANMDMSTPYMANKQALVVKKGNEDKFKTADGLKGATIVAEKGSAGEKVAQSDEFFKQGTFTAVDSQAKTLLEVKSGTADVAVIDYVMSIGSIGEGTDYADLTVVDGKGFNDEQYAIAFRKNSPDTIAKVNQAIQDLANDGTLAKIAEKYKLQDLLLAKPNNQ